jgi:endonuclease/exonuclease/phosphatase family metal-dependent hydrolase
MRVASWNMDHPGHSRTHDEAWAFLLGVEPDIALVQEAVVPTGLAYDSVFEPGWDHRPWGSGILSRIGELRAVWSDHERGAVVLAECTIPGLGPTVIGSVHLRIIDRRVIPPLRETFDEVRRRTGMCFIVGGDLNTARAAGKAWPRNGHTEFWAEVDASEFVDCYFALHGEERQSYWREWLRNKPPTVGNSLMDDHVFVDTSTRTTLHRSRIWDTQEVRALSDHGPVVIDLEVPR